MSTSESTINGNQSLCTQFIFVAFSSLAELQLVLFAVFLIIYLFTVGGNLIIICLIWVTRSLHTPMYFFLVNLSFLETCYITSVVPQMLAHLLMETKTISVGGCAAQMYVFTILGLTECCLLAAMAYDRFVAICCPLHYTLLMGPRVCLTLAAASWITGVVVESAQTTWIFTLPFCGTGKIQHFFCDIMPVVKQACVDTSHNEIVVFAVSVLFIMGPCFLILCSYVRILVTILRIPSAAGRRKAFSTCSSHILVVSLFYGTALFTHLQPKTAHTPGTDKATALMYTVVTPALNPVIYTLRNKEVKEAFQRGRQDGDRATQCLKPSAREICSGSLALAPGGWGPQHCSLLFRQSSAIAIAGTSQRLDSFTALHSPAAAAAPPPTSAPAAAAAAAAASGTGSSSQPGREEIHTKPLQGRSAGIAATAPTSETVLSAWRGDPVACSEAGSHFVPVRPHPLWGEQMR
ncbi:olfactory receptor 10C1-like [Carlito syrichta]|uniref:Olfactory receptor 10C1-like n=1 Tax=Carlito syrichta TaxID=1868482 RepID=A0A1U7TKD2_CARSF|nr:olfactory receptor 10C1-like [Carlito syrichta]